MDLKSIGFIFIIYKTIEIAYKKKSWVPIPTTFESDIPNSTFKLKISRLMSSLFIWKN